MTTIDFSAAVTDAHGNALSGDRETAGRYDAALDRLLRYHPAVVDQTVALVGDEPRFPMGHVLMAYLLLTSTDASDLPGVEDELRALQELSLQPREAAHVAAIGAWVAGDWHAASHRLDELLVRWPADLLALLVGHQLDFFLGDAANLRDRVGRSSLALDPDHPHQGFVLGMQAFGLEESGSYAEAEAAGLAALARHRDDVWAVHAVVHTHEMRGQVGQGIRFLQERRDDWAGDNLFSVHNWWHLALFLLEAGRPEDALAIHDAKVHGPDSAGIPLEMLDGTALLWRLLLDGVDTGGRFAALADAWTVGRSAPSWYVFNDLHAAMALVGAGRVAEARGLVDGLSSYLGSPGADAGPSNLMMTRDVGLPACRSVVAFGEERYGDVVADLLPVRRILQRFGGSHAQRDVLQRTLLEAALRGGQLDLARALLAERLSVRSSSVYGWLRRAQWAQLGGDGPAAEDARRRAGQHRDAFAAVAVAPVLPPPSAG